MSTYQNRRAKGLCGRCGKRKSGGRSMCEPCASGHSKRMRAYYVRLGKLGLCYRCREPRGHNGTATHCRLCAGLFATYQLARYYASKAREASK